jgi:CitMHS family citrate-Mg2+:H+ or citrate-Ca2+:H+ symporter
MKERKRLGIMTLPTQAEKAEKAAQAAQNVAVLQPAVAAEMNGTTGHWSPSAAAAARDGNVHQLAGGRVESTVTSPGEPALAAGGGHGGGDDSDVSNAAIKRPRLIWINFAMTTLLMVFLIKGVLPLPVLFMIFFAVAIMINYPGLEEQKERIAHHAANVLPVVSLIFAAGIFVGILQGTKMVDAIALSVIAGVPDWMGPYLAVVTGLLSIPFTFFISNDAFYFGIVPVLAKAAEVYGITAAEIGRASVIGQPVHLLSPLVASTYLLVGMCKVEFGDHQRFTLIWSISAALVMLVAALVFGVVPLMGSAA